MLQDFFINATILITFISIGNQFFKDSGLSRKSPSSQRLLFGVVSGVLGIILMYFSVHVSNNTIMDFRNLPIIMSAIYGGFLSAVTAGVLMAVFRLVFYGVDTSSVAALIFFVITVTGCGLISRSCHSHPKKWLYSIVFCLSVGSAAFSYVIPDKHRLLHILVVYNLGGLLVGSMVYQYVKYLIVSNRLFRKLKTEATHDFLTGLNNVRHYDLLFNQVSNLSLRKNEKLSLLYVDIDYFKKVNDTYGHADGDRVLQQIGQILLDTCRNFDIVSRIGGEEFSLILLDCPSERAVEVAERLRKAVKSHRFLISKGRPIHITISIGVATYPETTPNLDKLSECADSALYLAKHAGRNRVIFAEPLSTNDHHGLETTSLSNEYLPHSTRS